jgi:hypothetical protein
MRRTRPALNAQHVELADQIREDDCAVAGHQKHSRVEDIISGRRPANVTIH